MHAGDKTPASLLLDIITNQEDASLRANKADNERGEMLRMLNRIQETQTDMRMELIGVKEKVTANSKFIAEMKVYVKIGKFVWWVVAGLTLIFLSQIGNILAWWKGKP